MNLTIRFARPLTELSLQRDAIDLHIDVRMLSESHAAFHDIVVQDPLDTEVHPFRVVIARETEAEEA